MSGAAKQVEPLFLSPSAAGQVILKLKAWLQKEKIFAINNFVKTLPEELVGAVDAAYLTDLKQLNNDPDALAAEFDNTLDELKRLAAKVRLTKLSRLDKLTDAQKSELVETTRLLGYNHD